MGYLYLELHMTDSEDRTMVYFRIQCFFYHSSIAYEYSTIRSPTRILRNFEIELENAICLVLESSKQRECWYLIVYSSSLLLTNNLTNQ
jgi:hypothetical protein